MKKNIKNIIAGAVSSIVVGGSLIVGGLVIRNDGVDIRTAFQSGHWSVPSLEQRIGIGSREDPATQKENDLFLALLNTNKQCVGLAGLLVSASYALILSGAAMFVIGSISLYSVKKLKRELPATD